MISYKTTHDAESEAWYGQVGVVHAVHTGDANFAAFSSGWAPVAPCAVFELEVSAQEEASSSGVSSFELYRGVGVNDLEMIQAFELDWDSTYRVVPDLWLPYEPGELMYLGLLVDGVDHQGLNVQIKILSSVDDTGFLVLVAAP